MGQKVTRVEYYFYVPNQAEPHVVTQARDFSQALAFARNLHPQAQYLQRIVVMEETASPAPDGPIKGDGSHVV